jgi:DNA-binding CsgD family transcriptional regulator
VDRTRPERRQGSGADDFVTAVTRSRTNSPLTAAEDEPWIDRLSVAGCELAIISEPILPPAVRGWLTAAERAICEQLLRGDSQRAIAERRGTSVRTVANQVSRIFEKLGVHTCAELAALYDDSAKAPQ